MPDLKVYGPYPHRCSFRCYILTREGVRSWYPSGRTTEEALGHAQDAVAGFRSQVALTVGGLIEQYLGHLRANGRIDATITATSVKLRLLLGPLSDCMSGALTGPRAKARYLELAPTCAAASHQEALTKARSMWTWAIEEGMAKVNPWASVRPVGRANKGKAQLTVDETTKLSAVCLAHAMEDDGALAILVAILCGVRSSEILRRVVRDVDANGTRLLIQSAKTPRGKRAPMIPPVIQPAIAKRTVGRASDAPLIRNSIGHRPSNIWMGQQLTKYCALAGVPRVVPHALRGGWASMAYSSGATSLAVAAALGHASPTVTEAHYATPESVADAKQIERLRNLLGKPPGET